MGRTWYDDKTKEKVCHLDISLRLMRNPPGIENLHFCNNLNTSIMLNIEYRTPNTDFRSKGEGRINELIQLYPPPGDHGLQGNQNTGNAPIGSGLFILLGLGAAYGGKKVFDMKKELLEE